MNESAVSVFIVEDDRPMRERLSAIVSGDAELALLGSAGSLAEARDLLQDERPRVVLVDLGLPDGDGTELIRELAARDQPPEIMVITVFGDERHVVRAVQAGAAGYLLKDSVGASVVDAIVDVVAGRSPISPAIARHILRHFRTSLVDGADGEHDEQTDLTERQREVLRLVARGYTNEEIAELLEISYHTVTAHVKNIYRKLSVGSRSQAVFEARQLGILDSGEP